jgi:hypothetical protein
MNCHFIFPQISGFPIGLSIARKGLKSNKKMQTKIGSTLEGELDCRRQD